MWWVLSFLILAPVLAYHRVSLWLSSAIYLLYLILFSYTHAMHPFWLTFMWLLATPILVVLNIKPLRRQLLTRFAFEKFKSLSPKISQTEREALGAGSVGWEGDLFSGKPDWKKLARLPLARLTPEEQAFISGPVQQLCEMANDWEITHQYADLPPVMWEFMKKEGFFGLVIPKEYGGKEFSAYAHSEIVSILASCGFTLSTTFMVPNSLGPGELLVKYGTKEQRKYYLPRLACGEEIPCFALTGIRSGSDATTMSDIGVIEKGEFNGKEIIGIRLNFSKRYITLAPVATVVGLAFKLYDPDHLIGAEIDRGITCALLPSTIAGLKIGRRHFPLNCAFQNGPVSGQDVFIPFDYLIGGQAMIGQGWRMLVECLSVGRAISLPGIAIGGGRAATLASGAYCRIREQFGIAIGEFEGVQEKLALMTGLTYLMEASRLLTMSTIQTGEEPAVESAILKYNLTEMGRVISQAAMDVHGGKGICLGPNNYVGRSYQANPISITVEGANILTRSMIVFGQGAVRCHPYVYHELESVAQKDARLGLKKFDAVFYSHLGHITSNKVRAFWLGLTGGYLSAAPKGITRRYYQQFNRFSAAFGYLADACMVIFGANLKRMEFMSGRLADVLSMLFMGTAVLKRFTALGQPADELPLLHWSCQYILATLERQLSGILANYPYPWIGLMLRWVIFPWGRSCHGPKDRLTKTLAEFIMQPSAARSRITAGVYLGPRQGQVGVYQLLEEALQASVAAHPTEVRIRKAVAARQLAGHPDWCVQLQIAKDARFISEREYVQLLHTDDLRLQVIKVDDFAPKDLARV